MIVAILQQHGIAVYSFVSKCRVKCTPCITEGVKKPCCVYATSGRSNILDQGRSHSLAVLGRS